MRSRLTRRMRGGGRMVRVVAILFAVTAWASIIVTAGGGAHADPVDIGIEARAEPEGFARLVLTFPELPRYEVSTVDRKSTRLNSSHVKISYAVFCLKKKK